MTGKTKPLFGTRLIGDETKLTFTSCFGESDYLRRYANGWMHGSFRRPIRHLRDAKQALRDKGIIG